MVIKTTWEKASTTETPMPPTTPTSTPQLEKEVLGIQLFRERLSEKTVHATIPKDNTGYDQRTFPDTVDVESTFATFL